MRLLFIVLLICLCAVRSFATVAYDSSHNSNYITTAATSYTVTLSTTTANDCLVAYVLVGSTSVSVSNITGGTSISWNHIASHVSPSNGYDFEIWEGDATATQSSTTVTVHLSSSATSMCSIDGYKGAASSMAIEANHWTDYSSSGTNPLTGSVTTISANDLVVSGLLVGQTITGSPSHSAGTGFTLTGSVIQSSGYLSSITGEYATSITTTPGLVSTSFTNVGTSNNSVVGLAIRPPASSTGHGPGSIAVMIF